MFLLVTLWLSQAMIDFKRIIAIINCNQQRMRIIMQRKGEKAETWLSNILIDGKVISWLLMTDFSTVSTSAKSVGGKGKEWLCYTENYCPQLTVFLRNRKGLEKSCRPSIRAISVTGLQLGVSLFGSAVSCALGLLNKHAVSLHPLLGPASPNLTKTIWRRLVWGYYRA